jgi:hypothetical protein
MDFYRETSSPTIPPSSDSIFQYRFFEGSRNNAVGDFTGDGSDDIFSFAQQRQYSDWVISFHPEEEPLFVSDIIDGLNNRTNIKYSQLAFSHNYIADTSASFPLIDASGSFFVVDTVMTTHVHRYEWFNQDTYIKTAYFYGGGKLHAQGLGFLGFTRMEVEGELAHNVRTHTIEESEIVAPYFHPFRKKSIQVNRLRTVPNIIDTLSTTTFEPQYITFSEGRYLPVTQTTTTRNHLTESYTFKRDSFATDGNLRKTVTEIGDTTQIIKTSEQFFWHTTVRNCWKQNAMLSKQSKASHSDDATPFSFNHITRYRYDNLGRPLVVSIDSTEDWAVQDSIVYNDYGLVSETHKSAPKDSSIDYTVSHYYHYSADGRFLDKEINDLGDTTYYKYDTVLGLRTSTQRFLLKDSTEYNDWGFMIKEFSATGTIAEQSVRWATQPDSNNYALIVQTASSNNSPTVRSIIDIWGNEIRTKAEVFGGKTAIVEKFYNKYGLPLRVSSPYFDGETKKWSLYGYDKFNRKTADTVRIGTTDLIATTEYQDNNLTTIRTDAGGRTDTTIHNKAGDIVESIDHLGGKIMYQYSNDGKVRLIENFTVTGGNNLTEIQYDERGNKIALIDPNADTTSYLWNAFGQQYFQNTGGKVQVTDYDTLGRIQTVATSEGVHYYAYKEAGNHKHLLDSIQTASGIISTYSYDSLRRITSTTEEIPTGFAGTEVFTTGYGYDERGNQDSIQYPNFAVRHIFNSDGIVTEVRQADNNALLWELGAVNALGIDTLVRLGNGLETQHTHNQFGFLTNITTSVSNGGPAVQHWQYQYDSTRVLMTHRADLIHGQAESFTYDNLYRLDTARLASGLVRTVEYEASGNIHNKSDVGTYSYAPNRPAGVKEIQSPPPVGGCGVEW